MGLLKISGVLVIVVLLTALTQIGGIRTKALVILLASQNSLGKIFIEPHLKTRLGVISAKISFHGCKAVRHNDHIHVQLK